MTVFLLESYLGTVGEPDLVELAGRLSSAAESVSREGERVRYLHSTYVPTDETCLHFVETSTAAAAERFARQTIASGRGYAIGSAGREARHTGVKLIH